MMVRQLTYVQAAIAIAALTGITVLGVVGTVDGDAILAIYSAVIGAVLVGGGATLANGLTVGTYARGAEAATVAGDLRAASVAQDVAADRRAAERQQKDGG